MKFAANTNGMNGGLVLLNPNGTILSVNRTAARIPEFKKNDQPKDILSVDRDLKLSEPLSKTKNGEHTERIFKRFYRVDKSRSR